MNKEASRTLRSVVLLCAVGLFAVGCEPVRHYNRLQVAAYAGHTTRKPYGSASVFQKVEDIKRPYEVIGMLSCEGSVGEEAGILNAMLYRAANMGGDGVLLGVPTASAENLSAGNRIDLLSGWAATVGSGNRRAYRAQVIRFKD